MTETNMIFMMPTPPTNSEMPAIEDNIRVSVPVMFPRVAAISVVSCTLKSGSSVGPMRWRSLLDLVVEVHVQFDNRTRHERTDRDRQHGVNRPGGIDIAGDIARLDLSGFSADFVALLPIIHRRAVNGHACNAYGGEDESEFKDGFDPAS
ncbi:hypothetical protein [Roseimaritima sediminicola]|uniref:hypothetical protein n=1 Tax=Roseimaritima sediminicola TaxID=2662066 RepID=UPI00192A3E31|nr:hypothetical protein [Roseimaritima sediminicola]